MPESTEQTTDTTAPAPQAMLVSLTFKFGKQGGQDDELTETLVTKYNSDPNDVKGSKRTICKEAYEPLSKIRSEFSAAVKRLTVPWDIKGVYFSKPSAVAGVIAARNLYGPRFNEAKEQHLLGNYEQWKEMTRTKLRDAWREDEFPAREELALNVYWRMGISVLSEAEAFKRIRNLSEDVMEELRKSENERIQRGIKSGMATAYARLMTPLQHMVDVLSDDTKTRIMETLVENVRKIVEEIPGLNLIDDPQLAQFNTQVSAMITNLNADALRGTTKEVKVLRRAVAQQAADLLATFGTMGSRRFAV